MNPHLSALKPYPFERLRQLMQGVIPNPNAKSIQLSIGEPRHPSPPFVKQALIDHLDGLAQYPATLGREDLRLAIARWLQSRYRLASLSHEHQVIPTLGSREALFSIAQVVLDPYETDAKVLCPNPFYQIYEGAALLAGATPVFVNARESLGYATRWNDVPEAVWAKIRLVYTCSPGNPTGVVMNLEEWKTLFELSDRYGFVIAADECYSEIYFDAAEPPLGALEAAQHLGRSDYRRLVVLGSLSKRSNLPGLRSGYAAGDAEIIKRFTLYRTYHGSAMSPAVQHASIAAWEDEVHVIENRRLYREKFLLFRDILKDTVPLSLPAASFYYWMKTPIDDETFVRELYRTQHITVLPGSFLARAVEGHNPGAGHVRIALVGSLEETREAAERLHQFLQTILPKR